MKPEIKFRMVVFPHPEGPTMHSVFAFLTCRLIFDSTVVVPFGVVNVFVTFSRLINVSIGDSY